MARKMITFLGTSPYNSCIYFYGDKEWETSFVQTALINIFGPFDEVIVFVTKAARTKNWEKLYHSAQNQCPGCSIRAEDIDDGKSVDEIWASFNSLLSCIDEKDEVVFDITHSFRSIPVLALASLQYLRSLKDVRLSGIYYGAWEARETDDRGDGGESVSRAPIFDLMPFIDLMDWSRCIAEFSNYGESGSLKELLDKETGQVTKKLRNRLNTFIRSLAAVQNDIATCRGKLIYRGLNLDQLEVNLKKLKKEADRLPPAFSPMINRLEEKVQKLTGWQHKNFDEDIRRGFGAVQWCLEHNLTQQAYTLLQENLITYFCRIGGMDDTIKDPYRKAAGQSAATFDKDYSNWRYPAKNHKEAMDKIHGTAGKELLDLFEKLSADRNDINHGGMNSDISAKMLIDKIKDVFEKIRQCFEEGQQ